jgi:hypothetical protein
VEDVFCARVNYRVSGIVAACAARDDVCGFRKEIDDFAFTFVAPLGAGHNHISHDASGEKEMPERVRRSGGKEETGGCSDGWRQLSVLP